MTFGIVATIIVAVVFVLSLFGVFSDAGWLSRIRRHWRREVQHLTGEQLVVQLQYAQKYADETNGWRCALEEEIVSRRENPDNGETE